MNILVQHETVPVGECEGLSSLLGQLALGRLLGPTGVSPKTRNANRSELLSQGSSCSQTWPLTEAYFEESV